MNVEDTAERELKWRGCAGQLGRVELLAMVGSAAAVICGVQAAALEHSGWADIHFTWQVSHPTSRVGFQCRRQLCIPPPFSQLQPMSWSLAPLMCMCWLRLRLTCLP